MGFVGSGSKWQWDLSHSPEDDTELESPGGTALDGITWRVCVSQPGATCCQDIRQCSLMALGWRIVWNTGICLYFYPFRLLEHCRKHKYLSSSGEVFALLVSSLLENLLDYRTIIMHDESKENRMSCTVNVLVGAKTMDWWEGFARPALQAQLSSEEISQRCPGAILMQSVSWV